MPDAATADQIESTAKTLVSQRKSFSAWDISLAVKRLGFNQRHKDMKQIVHRLFENGDMGDYRQTLVQYPTAPRPAYLYHPPEIDPSDPNTLQAIIDGTVQAPALNAPAVDDNGDGDADDDDDDGSVFRPNVIRNADGSIQKNIGTLPGSCLYLPKDMARDVGIPPNGDAFISIDPASSQISVSAQGSSKACVDRNGNIRIGKTALLTAGINGNVLIKLDGNEIKISKA